MRKLTIIFAAALAGCASTTWNKPGASSQEFHADQSACASQAGMGQGTAGMLQQSRQQQIYEGCMQGKGWHAER